MTQVWNRFVVALVAALATVGLLASWGCGGDLVSSSEACRVNAYAPTSDNGFGVFFDDCP